MERILECVPNFSEGRNTAVIAEIERAIGRFKRIKVLSTDTGYDANRSVITFAGEPERVVDAAFEAVKTASALIDMRKHNGRHPRIGATDVLPLVPVQGISMAETVQLSYSLAERIGNELNIPVYCYEYSAKSPLRQKLENIRKGEYEALANRINLPEWLPDFGPATFNPLSGATVVGARNFLVAYNINLNTNNAEIAKKIAAQIRESGYYETKNGQQIHVPGKYKSLKAIGWYIDEYKKAQVSMNITNINETPVHIVFEEVKKLAQCFGTHVTGSELIGLIPLQAMIAAGKFYSNNSFANEPKLIELAVDKLGLNDLGIFLANKRIVEYCLK